MGTPLESKYLSKYQDSKLNSHGSPNSDIDSNDLLQQLEDELDNEDTEFLQRYRESRLEQLSQDIKQTNKKLSNNLQGLIIHHDEGQMMRSIQKEERAVLLMVNDTFQTCKILNHALEKVAFRHFTHTGFHQISALNAPFLCDRLQVKVLPLLLMYKNGIEVGRTVGLEGLLENSKKIDSISIERLETCLLRKGMLIRPAEYHFGRGKSPQNEQNDYGSDLDI